MWLMKQIKFGNSFRCRQANKWSVLFYNKTGTHDYQNFQQAYMEINDYIN